MNDLDNPIIDKISALLEFARNRVVVTVNQTMVLTYFEIGRMIVEEEQNGEQRAECGKELLKNISKELTNRFGRGFSYSNLKQIRQFLLHTQKDKHCLSFLKIPKKKLDRHCLYQENRRFV